MQHVFVVFHYKAWDNYRSDFVAVFDSKPEAENFCNRQNARIRDEDHDAWYYGREEYTIREKVLNRPDLFL